MMWAGHNAKARELVARRVIAKYDSNMSNYYDLGRPIHRSKDERKLQLKPDKADWFRSDGTTTTMVVPTTAGSRLANLIKNYIGMFPGPKGTREAWNTPNARTLQK